MRLMILRTFNVFTLYLKQNPSLWTWLGGLDNVISTSLISLPIFWSHWPPLLLGRMNFFPTQIPDVFPSLCLEISSLITGWLLLIHQLP